MSQPATKPPPPRRSGVIVPQKPKWHGLLAARIIYHGLKTLAALTRFKLEDDSGLLKGSGNMEPAIFAIWHNRLAYSMVIYHKFVYSRSPDHKLAAIVSASRDGGLLARILELFHVRPVRGSSSRRGPQALLEMASAAKDGCDLAITPDGPRGPCYKVQEGVMALAQVTGMPVVPVSYHLSFKIRLKSWDRFQVPLPFATCRVKFGGAIRISRDTSDTEREELRLKLENRLKEITPD